MSKAILVIDDIPENLFTENLSIKYQLIYYPDGHMKELGIHGKQLLKPMPEKKPTGNFEQYTKEYADLVNAENRGFNLCIDEILGGIKNNER